MVSGARWLFLMMIWGYVAVVLFQVFLAGMALFGAERDFELHRNLGYLIHLSPIPLIIVAAVARVGSRLLLWTAALFVVQGIQPLLPLLRADLPWAAALHPVLALIVFWLGLTIGLQAWRLPRPMASAAAQEV
jgi:putative tricarboxylic transport membrane protein